MNMTNEEYDKLEMAIDRYVDQLDLSDLLQIAIDNLWTYYRNSDADEARKEFIESMIE